MYFQEVGEESKLARSFERIRSIVKKKKYKQEHTENQKNMKLEEMVRQVMSKHKGAQLEAMIRRDGHGMKETVLDSEPLAVAPVTPVAEERVSSPDNIFSPEHRFSSASQELSKQLQEVLNEKIKSLQSSRNQLYDYGGIPIGENLDVSPLTDRKSSTSERLFSPAIEDKTYSALSSECHCPYYTKKDGQPGNPMDLFSPGCETCFHFSPEFPSSPGQRSHSGYTPRPSDNQLTFLSPPDSNSCSIHEQLVQRQNSNSEVFINNESLPRKDTKSIFSPVNVSRYSPSDNQTPSPISEKRSLNGKRSSIASSDRKMSRCSDSDRKTGVGDRRNSDVSQVSDGRSNPTRRSSQLSVRSGVVSARCHDAKNGLSSPISDIRTSPKYSPNIETSRSSPNPGDSRFRDSSTSESEPVYSPPSHSSLSPLDKRYSVVFSPPSDTNFSFSLPVDKVYGSVFSPPTITDSSTSQQAIEVSKENASPNDTIISTPTDKKLSPEMEERPQLTEPSPQSEGDVLSPPPTRDKRYYTVIEAGPRTYTHTVPSPIPSAKELRSARDKRLSYFLAIEQGESKGESGA